MLDHPAALGHEPFADPARQGQQAFRAVMNAMARPATRHRLAAGEAPDALDSAAAAVILALCDYETPLWLSPAFAAAPAIGAWITFHTGAPRVSDPRLAAFALVDLARDGLDLAQFAQGVPDYPDRSTTVIAVVPSLASGPALGIAGPGIRGEASLSVEALPSGFRAQWAVNRERFPLGVDMIFCAHDAVAGLPRSTRIAGEAL